MLLQEKKHLSHCMSSRSRAARAAAVSRGASFVLGADGESLVFIACSKEKNKKQNEKAKPLTLILRDEISVFLQ